MSKQRFLMMLLRRRGLWYSVWYRRSHPRGWMMGTVKREAEHYDRLGYSFYQAVEMIASGTLDFLKDAEENVPMRLDVAMAAPDLSDEEKARR